MHKVLASCGFGSRRAMEEMIVAGRITVNRMPAEVGQKVGPGDEVRINGELVRVRFAEPRARILMYHKPAGEIVTRDDPEGRPTVFAKLPSIGNGKWINVGRLDYNTEGLLLFTNLGELANRLMHPRYEVEREYAVRILGELTPEHVLALTTGIALDDGMAKCESVEDGGGEGSNHWYKVVLKEGRNREVRRLFEALNLTVSRLIRTRYGTLAMPSVVKRGDILELQAHEVEGVLATAGLNGRPAAEGHRPRPPKAPGRGPHHGGRPPRQGGPRPNESRPGHSDAETSRGGPRPHDQRGPRLHDQRGPRPHDQRGPRPHDQHGPRPPHSQPEFQPHTGTEQRETEQRETEQRSHSQTEQRSHGETEQRSHGETEQRSHGETEQRSHGQTEQRPIYGKQSGRPHGKGAPRLGRGQVNGPFANSNAPGTHSGARREHRNYDEVQPQSNANASPFGKSTLTVPGGRPRGAPTVPGAPRHRSGPRAAKGSGHGGGYGGAHSPGAQAQRHQRRPNRPRADVDGNVAPPSQERKPADDEGE